MKKIFILIVIYFLTLPAFAAVQQTETALNIQSPMLKEKCNAYEITLLNTGKNPVKISNIEITNLITNSNELLTSDAMQGIRKNNKYIYLDLLTFGITGFIGNAKNNKILTEQKAAIAEAANFEVNLSNKKNEIIMPQNSTTFKILVPIGETPSIKAVFQDTKTSEYISITK